jgi:hypothetical protein
MANRLSLYQAIALLKMCPEALAQFLVDTIDEGGQQLADILTKASFVVGERTVSFHYAD